MQEAFINLSKPHEPEEKPGPLTKIDADADWYFGAVIDNIF